MNAFSGTLPDSIGSAWTQMDTFTANENMLSGTIPSSVGNWSKARFFWIADNQINGTLPDTIGEWKALQSFDVSLSRLRRLCSDVFKSVLTDECPSRSPEIFSQVTCLNQLGSGQIWLTFP